MGLVPSALRSATTLRRLALAGAIVCAAACRPSTSPAPREPVPSPAPVASVRTEAPRKRNLQDIVAVVDGVAIREAEVDRLVRVASTSPAAPRQPREVLVLQLVERRLVEHEAAAQQMAVTEEEIDRAVRLLASDLGITMEQLRTAVDEHTELSWEEYRQEIAAQILEMKLVMTTLPRTDATEWDVRSATLSEERLASVRERMVGCLRARAKVTVEDASVELPDNPFAIAATLAGVRFVEDPGLPAAEVEATAKSAAAGRPLCDAIAAAEVAMTELYLEHGHLDVVVTIPWPETPGTTIVEVEAVPGARSVIGEIGVDQSAVPKRKRLEDRELRRRIAAVGKPGDVASLSRLHAIAEVVRGLFGDAGVGPVKVEVTLEPVGEEKRVDMVFRVGENEA
jgi:hypothetical protein